MTADITATCGARRLMVISSVELESRKLLELALSQSTEQDQGERLPGASGSIKARGDNRSRDDSTAALLLAVGAAERAKAGEAWRRRQRRMATA